MKTLIRFLVIVLILGVATGVAYLAIWTPPAPLAPVEKVIPDDRFPR